LVTDDTHLLFADSISLVDVLPDPVVSELAGAQQGILEKRWGPAKSQTLSLDSLGESKLWNVLQQETDKITSASFGYVSASSENESTFNTLLKFSGKGGGPEQTQVSFQGQVDVGWIHQEGRWKIKSWVTQSLSATSRQRLLFRNRMSELFSEMDFELATRSLHEEKVANFVASGHVDLPRRDFFPYFHPESGYQHPSVSVVDINGDGWDDLFVTSNWGKCQLWVNEKGSKFTEQAAAYGLDVDYGCTSAMFADLDNDGDADLILGRSLERSQLFWNEDGQYVASPDELPYLVTSVSAADCNNDGLLDLYLCTYGPTGAYASTNPEWVERFVSRDAHRQLVQALRDSHRYYNQAGPPNTLLINRGERKFDAAPANPAIDQYRNTYQASWADYDQDGDVDVYVCNDFAPDALLRNDGAGENGLPNFVDVSQVLSGDTMKGFGMGASWGDYDNDQQLDLFVTNMYSKAGKRVLSRFDDIDDRLHFSARGNLLFHQHNGAFHQLAGERDAFPVNQGGWAFGGQFVDVDNDSWLDLYVPCGFYTAPKSVASEVDL
jgi:hypothetical protein